MGGVSPEREIVVSRVIDEPDWELVGIFARSMRRSDLRLRFGAQIDPTDDLTLRRFFGVAADTGDVAWLFDSAGFIAGMSHRVRVARATAEVALVVRSDLKRVGLGRRLLDELIVRSTREGLATLSGFVLWENRPMLALARQAGFASRGSCGPNLQLELVLAS
jgi:acetyltransferase